MEIKFTIPGPPKGKQRPRICKVNGRSVAYTPKETIEYERLVRASYTALSKAKFERSLPLEIRALLNSHRCKPIQGKNKGLKVSEVS